VRTVVVTFKVDDEVVEILDRIAFLERTSRSDIIRTAIHVFIKNYREKHLRGKTSVRVRRIAL